MLKFLECLDSRERILMKYLIANAKNALIESRSKHREKLNDRPNNTDILNFAGDLLHEIIKMEKNEF